MSRPALRVGHVTADAKGVAFVPPAEPVFDCAAGEEVDLVLTYAFEETSRDMERFHVRLRAQVDGRALGEADSTVKDRPVADDSERGAVTLAARFATPGLHAGRFEVEAEYTAGAWGAKEEAPKSTLREGGRFLVRVH